MCIISGDILHARCEFVSHRDTTTHIGSTGKDEMCNFYMMYHMNATKFRWVPYSTYHDLAVPTSALGTYHTGTGAV